MIDIKSAIAVGGATLVFGYAGVGVGYVSKPANPRPAVIVNEISISEDGTTTYDRSVIGGGGIVSWSGQIFNADGTEHCSGGSTWNYEGGDLRITDKDADWLVGGDCIDGLEAGMTFLFTYTPVEPQYAPSRYPQTGLGVVE